MSKIIGVTVGMPVKTDDTLVHAGKPADAKAVGDALKNAGKVQSVNGKTGDVQLNASDVGAQPVGDYITKDDLSGVVEDAVSDAVGDLVGEAVEDLVGGSLEDIVTDIVEDVISGESDAFSETGEVVELAVEAETPLSVISKIHRDETWGLSDKLVLHQVSGSNFVDLSTYLGGAGTVFTLNGLTATVNADSTVTITGTNEKDGYTNIINKFYGAHVEKVYPAGTYRIPDGFMMQIRAAQYPDNINIDGLTGNRTKTITVAEPFRVVALIYAVKANETVDITVPLGLFRGDAVPETGREYIGNIYTATFDVPVYEGEFNWSTGELKDADGNTVAYYDSHDIMSLQGTNYFWTGFGENTVSNRKDDGKVLLRLNETAPEETVPSICDFTLTPTTLQAAYGLYYSAFLPNGKFNGHEVPVLTTKGTLSVKDVDGNVKYSKYIESMFNARGITDVLTHNGLEKRWSGKFYLTKDPVSITESDPPPTGAPQAYIFVWEFDESEFVNTGIPAKIRDIPMVSPCFRNNDTSEESVNTQTLYYATPYPAFFSYSEETGKYVLTVRGIKGSEIKNQLTSFSKVHFYYQLETPYVSPFAFAMGIDAGDRIFFESDIVDAQQYIDAKNIYQGSSGYVTEVNVDPSIIAFVPRNVEDAMDGMTNAARILNADDSVGGGDATVQGYSWIGDGDGATDYTTKIQNKINEIHLLSNGGTIHLGSGTYPINNSLIVYDNTRIIGNGETIIEQKADNTHAVIWSGSNIVMRDLTIKLSGVCTDVTACIYANSNNRSTGDRDERYPENTYVWNCSVNNVTLIGGYGLGWNGNYRYLSEEALAHRGVGIYSKHLFFNFFDCDGLYCKRLYAGVCNGGGSNNYRIFVTESRMAVVSIDVGSGNNRYEIKGHSLYGVTEAGDLIQGTDYVVYSEDEASIFDVMGFYDTQYTKCLLYFGSMSMSNVGYLRGDLSALDSTTVAFDNTHRNYIDYGRNNEFIRPSKRTYFSVGNRRTDITGQMNPNKELHPAVDNALAGAGVWGNITSNVAWNEDTILLSDVCRYPKDWGASHWIGSVVSTVAPSDDTPVEIEIDISNRPIHSYPGLWIQFDHRYVAQDGVISFDTTNDGNYNQTREFTGNVEPVWYNLYHQNQNVTIYRIKISITKTLQIPELPYQSTNYTDYTINYNPDGLVGIVNIGMVQNDAYGRAFLGECGGSLYGNVDMHQNTLKNLPAPTEDGDAVSKAYLEQRLAELEALISRL